MNWFSNIFTKENPAQALIAYEEGTVISSTAPISYQQAFDLLDSVSRGSNMIISGCASLDYDIKDKISEGVVSGTRQKSLVNLLNFKPNPYQTAQDFRISIFTDFILEGNIFIYWDGAALYHLPANKMQIITDNKTFVSEYRYMGVITFRPDEVIHVKEISGKSIYRGTSRLSAAERSIQTLYKMQNFQDQFFDNGAIPGLVLETENTLSQLAKDKTIQNWAAKYSPKNGARKPMILDSGLKLKGLFSTSFQELDFDTSIKTHSDKVLKALGVPPILLDGGNNANINPNLRLFYLETIMPIIRRYVSAMERFFGYDIDAITSNVSALQPDIKEIATYHSTLVNAGILTPNEARLELRYAPLPGQDEIRVPANIAGSAVRPDTGGAPKQDNTNTP
jgi:HK97 family phage portal protein